MKRYKRHTVIMINYCIVCNTPARKKFEGEYMCCKHHPDSIKKRAARQLRYYHTDKGKASYDRYRKSPTQQQTEIITTQ